MAVASIAKDWGPIIIGVLGVLTGLVTFLYGIEAELQQGHLKLFLGDGHPLCVAAALAIVSYRYAIGWAREEQAPSRAPDAAFGDATAAKDGKLSEASAYMADFWRAAREAGITRDVRLGDAASQRPT